VQVLETAREYGVTPMVLYNLKGLKGTTAARAVDVARGVLDPDQEATSLQLDLHAKADVPTVVAGFLQDGVSRSRKRTQVRLAWRWQFGVRLAPPRRNMSCAALNHIAAWRRCLHGTFIVPTAWCLT
jgi:hypothetical protein